MGRSLHEQAGISPNLTLPMVAVASLDAPDFKRLRAQDPAMNDAVLAWLEVLARHPLTPPDAKRTRGIVDIRSFEATNQWPWWRCLVVKVNPATGQPIPDPEKPGLYESIYFTPATPPPVGLIEALDEMSGHALRNRIDGGPTPANPGAGGAGRMLPAKTPIRR